MPAATLAAPDPAEPAPGPWLGLTVAPQHAAALEDSPAPLVVRVPVRWSDVEREPGRYDWSRIEPVVSRFSAAGHRVALSLRGSNSLYLGPGEAPTALRGESLEAWVGFARDAARRFAGRVEVLELGDAETIEDPKDYAFLLKSAALGIRAETPAGGPVMRIAQAPVSVTALEFQVALWEEDVAAYIDVLPVTLESELQIDPLAGQLARLLTERVRHPPAPEIWALVDPAGIRGPSLALAALSAGADAALVGTTRTDDPVADWVAGARAALAGGYAPAPLGTTRFVDAEGRSRDDGRVLARFFNPDGFSTILFYELPGEVADAPTDRLVVAAPALSAVTLLDPATGETLPIGSAPVERPLRGRSIRVNRGRLPLAVTFRQPSGPAGFEVPLEAVETTRSRELTAEEIIARHQAASKLQQDRLERFTAQGRIDLRFRLAQGGGTVIFSIEANYFWERGGALEWEETGYYLNGNKVTWKKIPDLPLIQPEKVLSLPLDLTLDRTYAYRLIGRERVAGREAYVLAFEPVDPDTGRSLYRGRLWVDTASFVLLRTSLTQTELEAPVLSNEERNDYGELIDAEGRSYRLITRVNGQQTWNVAGNNFIVLREINLDGFDVNPPRERFDEKRERAYASEHKMMRSTDSGARYLERQPDGTRTVKKIVHAYLFAAAGAVKDSSTGGVQPLAGVNYFNYDLGGSDIQVNAFFAGVFGVFTGSKPDLIGRRGDGTLDFQFQALMFEDKFFREAQEVVVERVESRGQSLNFQLGFPLGEFFKFDLFGGGGYREFGDNDEARAAREAISSNPGNPWLLDYRLPSDHLISEAGVRAQFNRRGWTIGGNVAGFHRSEWEPWGLFDVLTGQPLACDPASGTCSPTTPEPLFDSYTRWRVGGFKEWFLPKFQTIQISANYLDGKDLDRFSRYRFSFLGGASLAGFSGSGVRFDQGIVGNLEYGFNLFEAVQFELSVEAARVEDLTSGSGDQRFTGLGFSGNFVGPWTTVIQLSFGYALQSDIPALEGEQEFLVLVLKLF